MLNTLIYQTLGIKLTEAQLSQFDAYYNLLVAFNKHTNLTRIVSRHDADVKHFLDSMLLCRLTDFNNVVRVCDMGAGAGFPSIPLLILFPKIKVTIVESQIKRVNFLKQLKALLNLSFEIVHERAEVFSSEHIETFDLVMARALGELRLILEFGVPMLKTGGYFIAPKGSKYENELQDAKEAIKVLNVKLVKTDIFELPESNGFRSNLLFKKEKHTTGFPRPFALIKKKPL
ncbi:MAG: 16S rRNA (guanine(527)-N(7))-methyltransferase RsmG [Acholeplasma sp.]